MATSLQARASIQEITLSVILFNHNQAVSSKMKRTNIRSELIMIPKLGVLSRRTVKIDRIDAAVRVFRGSMESVSALISVIITGQHQR